MKLLYTAVILLFYSVRLFGEAAASDSLQAGPTFDIKPFIIPVLLITYGTIGVESDELKLSNAEIKEEVNEHIDEKVSIDDFSQYAPFVSVYALNALGVHGRHNLRDRTVILGTAYGMVGVTVLGLKRITREKRPDGTSRNSFPSGHTATAFMGAEFMYQEFKNVSVWYGVTAYLVATGTGLFRVYNDRHWLTDVIAGAGFGMMSTKLSYLWHERKMGATQYSVLPYYNGNNGGVTVRVQF